jgi:ketosteroid isomerase-like protein
MSRMSQLNPDEFAARWCADWNAHDLDSLLEHFTDDVVFASPVAQRVLGTDGIVRGKAALREYWRLGLEKIPDLRFTVEAVYAGIDTIVINYRNQQGNLVCEVLHFEGDRVREGHGTYLGVANPEGASR